MRVVIAGGSGLLGRALASSLAGAAHQVVVLGRSAAPPPGLPPAGERPTEGRRGPIHLVRWDPDGRVGPWTDQLHGAGVIVNLAGSSIAAGRWTSATKARILESRLQATRSLVEAVGTAGQPPPALLSASAVGYYGTSDDRRLAEDSPAGRGFLAEVCIRWEEEARRAERFGSRVVLLRTGVVLSAAGGALPRMLAPFRLFAGGRIGQGRQFVSWIHIRDWVDLVRVAIDREDLSGPLNLTAPSPVTSRQLAAAIGRALGRPAWLPVPALALRLALGKMADETLLSGQRVMPARALALGYRFAFGDVDGALRDLLSRRSSGDSRGRSESRSRGRDEYAG